MNASHINSKVFTYTLLVILLSFFCRNTYAQTEVEPWGNLTGIRIDGELMPFETSVIVADEDFKHVRATALEQQHPSYHRDGSTQTIITQIDSFYLKEDVVENIAQHAAKINLHYRSATSKNIWRLYYCISLPAAVYKNGSVTGDDNHQKSSKILLSSLDKQIINTKKIIAAGTSTTLNISLLATAEVIIRKQQDGDIYLYIPLAIGAVVDSQQGDITINLSASGKVNKMPVTLNLNVKDTGAVFAGFGGNFRLQNPQHDPQVIDYCLNNMRVAYSRVEMSWMQWQPEEDSNPIDSAKAGKLNQHVKESMEMAQRLSKILDDF